LSAEVSPQKDAAFPYQASPTSPKRQPIIAFESMPMFGKKDATIKILLIRKIELAFHVLATTRVFK
jgi:hypothetical protein